MHTIVSSKSLPNLLAQFREWVAEEWGEISPLESRAEEYSVPAPLLATDKGILLGGLGFTSFAKPKTEDNAIWINTLYVAPEFRNCGIASDLLRAAEHQVRAAEHQALDLQIDELFVFTNIPELYEKHGWQYVDSVEESTVLKKSFKN